MYVAYISQCKLHWFVWCNEITIRGNGYPKAYCLIRQWCMLLALIVSIIISNDVIGIEERRQLYNLWRHYLDLVYGINSLIINKFTLRQQLGSWKVSNILASCKVKSTFYKCKGSLKFKIINFFFLDFYRN